VNEPQYKTLNFLEMMINMGVVCEKCGDKPSFPDKWYFIPDPKWANHPIVCPTCLEQECNKDED
jgi:hypothetical protein